jgi:hypothetical protein
MNELESLIERHYQKRKKKAFSMEVLLEMVEDVFTDFRPILKEEARTAIPKSAPGKEMKVTVSMIPDIEVSELGWSDVRTPEEGSPVKGRERQILEDYLNNIVGQGGIETLPRKLEELSKLADNPEAYVKSLGTDKTPGEKIRTVISFLVFYKTLTKIVANFNAASAGFSFESFLATLLNGIQIPASGADTIADFEDQDGVRVSLKLYAEKTLEVGGSFTDLVGDLIEDGKMTYLAVTKNLKGSREKMNGELTFYKFDFTLDNVMEILSDSKAISARCVILPLEKFADEELPQKINTRAFLQDKFEEHLGDLLGDKGSAEKIIKDPYFKFGSDEFGEISTGSMTLATRGTKAEMLLQVIRGIFEKATEEEIISIANAALNASKLARKDYLEADKERKSSVAKVAPSFSKYTKPPGSLKSKENKAKVNAWIGDVMSASKESTEFYSKLSTEDKKRALLRTNGYLNNLQFALNKAEVVKISSEQAGGEASIGTLTIGTESLQKMLDSSIAALNTDVFSVFTHLQTLSDSLNSFFAGGLADTASADKAIQNADAIEGKTEKMKK